MCYRSGMGQWTGVSCYEWLNVSQVWDGRWQVLSSWKILKGLSRRSNPPLVETKEKILFDILWTYVYQYSPYILVKCCAPCIVWPFRVTIVYGYVRVVLYYTLSYYLHTVQYPFVITQYNTLLVWYRTEPWTEFKHDLWTSHLELNTFQLLQGCW